MQVIKVGSVVKGWVEVQREQAMAECGKKQLVKLTVCVVNCEKLYHFIDQERENLESVKYECYLTEK